MVSTRGGVRNASKVSGDNIAMKAQNASEKLVEQPDADDGHANQQEALDAFRKRPQIAKAVQDFIPCLNDATAFLQPNQDISGAARSAARALYEYGVRSMLMGAGNEARAQTLATLTGLTQAAGSSGKPVSLVGKAASKLPVPELCVDSVFDAEQIWVQLDMATDATLKKTKKLLSQMAPLTSGQSSDLIHPKHAAAIDAIAEGDLSSESDGSDEDLSSSDEVLDNIDREEDGFEDEDGDVPGGKKQKTSKSGADALSDKPLKPTEDRFLRLDDMEAFLQDAEEQYEKQQKRLERLEQEEREAVAGGRKQNKDRERIAGGLFDEEEDGDDLEEQDDFDEAYELNTGSGSDDDLDLDDLQDDDGQGGDDDEDDEDDKRLRAVLDKAAGKPSAATGSGKKKATKKKGKDQGVTAMYADFFGPAPPRGGDADEQQQTDDQDQDSMEQDQADDDQAAVPGSEELDDDDLDLMGGGEDVGEGEEDYEDEDDDEIFTQIRERGGLVGSEDQDQDGDEDDMDEDEDVGGKQRRKGGDGDTDADGKPLSNHQKRLLRIQEQIRELEGQALGAKDWQLTGEVDGSRRPLNSALEVDMEFDTTVKPAPEPTQEAMEDIETLIKKRIKDHKYDDVIRILPAEPVKQRKEIELNDSKAAKGLAEEYADDFSKAAAAAEGIEVEEESKQHKECKMLFQALMSKLDALSHFHFAPKPVVEELTIKTDVAAVAMEEAAPVAVSAATMKLPGEVFRPTAVGAPQAEGELTKEDRKRRRAKRKRGNKSATEQKEADARARAAATGQQLPISDNGVVITGRKSAAAIIASKSKAAKSGIVSRLGEGAGGKTKFGKSAAVFAQIQQNADLAKAGGGAKTKAKSLAGEKPPVVAANLKL